MINESRGTGCTRVDARAKRQRASRGSHLEAIEENLQNASHAELQRAHNATAAVAVAVAARFFQRWTLTTGAEERSGAIGIWEEECEEKRREAIAQRSSPNKRRGASGGDLLLEERDINVTRDSEEKCIAHSHAAPKELRAESCR